MNDEIKELIKECNELLNDDFFTLDNIDITRHELTLLLDYITNLQQKIKHYEETQTFGDYVKEVNLLVDYKTRCEKAIEFINQNEIQITYHELGLQWMNVKDDLLNILNGRSDE